MCPWQLLVMSCNLLHMKISMLCHITNLIYWQYMAYMAYIYIRIFIRICTHGIWVYLTWVQNFFPCNPELLIPTKLLAEKPTDLPVSCQTWQGCWLWKPQQTRTQDELSTYKWWKFLTHVILFFAAPIQKKQTSGFSWNAAPNYQFHTVDTLDGFNLLAGIPIKCRKSVDSFKSNLGFPCREFRHART